ncbi:scavenger receptor class F member 1-like isoform X1 [Haliotis cracherodii]|uniref:scavenger receptor class F member 1-like isoform X1 n=1 Tax=Haliotis cracherodii TaxID=6455 RepID=UPI0039ECC666
MVAMDRLFLQLLLLLSVTSSDDAGPLIEHCEATCDNCQSGWYGNKCTLECTKCQNDKCQKSTGECDNCKHGFYGKRCNETCSPNCRKNTACNRNNGHCDDGCLPRYWGGMCDRNCSQMCNNSVCMHNSGKCHLGCKDGWTGFYCNISCETGCVNKTCAQITDKCIECKNNNGGLCENNEWCLNVCEQCNKDGRCTAKSIGSKEENGTVDESESNVAATVGGVIGAILMVTLLVVVVIVLYRKRRRLEHGSQAPEPEADRLNKL